MFKGRRLVIATKHKKEQVLAPLLQKSLEVKCFVPTNFDTDVFGTFSGEVERKEGPVNTIRRKCLEAMKMSHCDLGVASEGSFGSHPSLPFVSANEEFLIFIDKRNGLEILVKELSTETNFAGEEIRTGEELSRFAELVGFPSHGLVMRGREKFHKGITNRICLEENFEGLLAQQGSVFIETDMRALYNPTRMKVIEKAAQKLVEKIRSCCPECGTPGFGVVAAKEGLPCRLCGCATRSTLNYLYECVKCLYTKVELYPHGKKNEDPMYCDMCNP